MVAYYDNTNRDLKVAECSDPACSSSTLRALDNVGIVGQYPSIIIKDDGNTVISYRNATNLDLMIMINVVVSSGVSVSSALASTGQSPIVTSVRGVDARAPGQAVLVPPGNWPGRLTG